MHCIFRCKIFSHVFPVDRNDHRWQRVCDGIYKNTIPSYCILDSEYTPISHISCLFCLHTFLLKFYGNVCRSYSGIKGSISQYRNEAGAVQTPYFIVCWLLYKDGPIPFAGLCPVNTWYRSAVLCCRVCEGSQLREQVCPGALDDRLQREYLGNQVQQYFPALSLQENMEEKSQYGKTPKKIIAYFLRNHLHDIKGNMLLILIYNCGWGVGGGMAVSTLTYWYVC